MASQLDRAIARNRAALRSVDRSALAQVMAAYRDVLDRLNPLIELAAQEAASGKLSRNDMMINGQLVRDSEFRFSRYQELRRQTAVELERLARITGDVTTEAQARAVQLALDGSADLATATARGVQAQATITAGWVHLPTSAVEDLVGLANNGPLRDLLQSFGDDGMRVIAQELVSGLALGQGPRQVADAIERGMKISRNRALTIARTELLRSARSASIRNYQANADILAGFIWTASHSARTCLACLSLDGQKFPLSVTFFPSHINCRCAPRPWLKDMPQRTVTTGEEWFNQQPLATQQAMIPKTLWPDYMAGNIELSDFIQPTQSAEWGRGFREATIPEALANAERRERRAA